MYVYIKIIGDVRKSLFDIRIFGLSAQSAAISVASISFFSISFDKSNFAVLVIIGSEARFFASESICRPSLFMPSMRIYSGGLVHRLLSRPRSADNNILFMRDMV